MKDRLEILIRRNVLETIIAKLPKKEQKNFDDVVEDALIYYLDIKINEIAIKDEKEEVQEIPLEITNLGYYTPNYGYYVYVFMDPRIKKKYHTGIENLILPYEPFYIGKGFGDRMEKEERNEEVNRQISIIKKSGMNPIIIKIKDKLSNINAYKLENFLINKIGRKDSENGPLLNQAGGIRFTDLDDIILDIQENHLETAANQMILSYLNNSRSKHEAAKKLGISERTLYRKIKGLNIKKNGKKYSFE